jgi:hypothetical protein
MTAHAWRARRSHWQQLGDSNVAWHTNCSPAVYNRCSNSLKLQLQLELDQVERHLGEERAALSRRRAEAEAQAAELEASASAAAQREHHFTEVNFSRNDNHSWHWTVVTCSSMVQLS